MEPIVQSASERLFQFGVLGILVFVFGAAILLLWREAAKERGTFIAQINELQKLRVDDAKAVQVQLVDIAKQSTHALNTVSTVVESTRVTMVEVRDTLRELGEDVRNSRGPRGGR